MMTIKNGQNKLLKTVKIRLFSSSVAKDNVRIGNVVRPRGILPADSPYVSSQYLDNVRQQLISTPQHLRWMMQKDELAQDMLLIGNSGTGALLRRRLAMAFAEMMQRQVQLLAITPDTTEADLKQRRELVRSRGNQTQVTFIDQAPVSAAIHGHILILDGLDKAERNVLPTLNNLLEHREMHLEDGRFLVSPRRYQTLQQQQQYDTNNSESLLVPVHPDFRVVALAVPPLAGGRTLDPPLRSRFQIRRIDSSHEFLLDQPELATFVQCMDTAAQEQPGQVLSFPSFALPEHPTKDRLLRIYPVAHPVLPQSGKILESSKVFHATWKQVMKKDNVGKQESPLFRDVQRLEHNHRRQARVSLLSEDRTVTENMTVPCGSSELQSSLHGFVLTPGLHRALTAMMEEHARGRDLLLLAASGESKSVTASFFAKQLGYPVHLIHIYQEMSVRDLFLRRTTDPKTGETIWLDSPLVNAARNGDICILDGVEKLRPHLLSALQSFCVDRDMFLPDGRRLLGEDRGGDSHIDKIIPVHPAFRIIALASLSNNKNDLSFLEDSVGSAIFLPKPTWQCSKAILTSVNPQYPEKVIEKLLALREKLTPEIAKDCGVSPLSTRNLIRIVRCAYYDGAPYSMLRSVFLMDLLPPTQRAALESLIKQCGIPLRSASKTEASLETVNSIHVDPNEVKIGDFRMTRKMPLRPEMVPSPVFFDIPSHVATIKDLLIDWTSGERAFLLLGNQGVGKNILVDRLCQLANFEREYIQLHRDSTVGQITLQPTLEDGKIVWKDSPLVRAVTNGLCLVVDEADKAPTEVLSVLKGLVEDGELLLADGRRISRHEQGPNIIELHKDFTLWLLANRPGFPFHGNAFVEQIGDCFSTRVVTNPDLESEIELLSQYGPNVDSKMIRKIAASFAELRYLSDIGDLSYPYSTREAVAVVKHLQKYSDDGVVSALHNVLDFDSFDPDIYGRLSKVFQQHGIPVESYQYWKTAQDDPPLEIQIETDGSSKTSSSPPPLSMPKRGQWDDQNDPHVGGNQWAGGTGGSDTAGLGGRGGPYRLDRGHRVHQVSDAAKAQVSAEAQQAARAIAQKALKERLQEISMSESEWTMYQRFVDPIRSEISSLRSVLNQVELKETERGWIKQQSDGELDDSKLVDGVVGERYVYKRRGILEDGGPMQRPKRLRFVMDCSASMYRFNGYDQRLTRSVEAATLIMESFHGMESRFDYSIVGHSGDSPSIPLVAFRHPPANEKERMRVLQMMIAHSQYCQSGDHTLDSIERAIEDVSVGNNLDEVALVVAMSDANLERYGIHPRELRKIMESGDDKKVKSHCIFIASLGREADEIRRELPPGRGHVCLSTSDLPRTVRNILTSTL